jgi:hypothetical protein
MTMMEATRHRWNLSLVDSATAALVQARWLRLGGGEGGLRWTPIFGPKKAASKEESAPLVFG